MNDLYAGGGWYCDPANEDCDFDSLYNPIQRTSTTPGIILGCLALLQLTWSIVLQIVDQYSSTYGFQFSSFWHVGLNVACLIIWIFRGALVLIFPIAYTYEIFAQIYMFVCIINYWVTVVG